MPNALCNILTTEDEMTIWNFLSFYAAEVLYSDLIGIWLCKMIRKSHTIVPLQY